MAERPGIEGRLFGREDVIYFQSAERMAKAMLFHHSHNDRIFFAACISDIMVGKLQLEEDRV